jgi:hypothetical protein
MKMKLLASALLSTACFVGAAQASTVNLDIDLIVVSSNNGDFVGNISTLTLTYNTDDITTTNNSLTATPLPPLLPFLPFGPDFDFIFSNLFGFGQTFTDLDDPNAILEFGNAPNSNPTNLILSISETEPGANVGIDNPNVFGFATFGSLLTATTGNPTITVRVDNAVQAPAPVPVPASALLLGTALLGAGAVSRRRRRKS